MSKIDTLMNQLEKKFEKNPEGFKGAVPDSKIKKQEQKNRKSKSPNNSHLKPMPKHLRDDYKPPKKDKKKNYSLSEKEMYYERRVNDLSLSFKQRAFAKNRLKQIRSKFKPPKSLILKNTLLDIVSFRDWTKTKNGYKAKYYADDGNFKTIYLNLHDGKEWSELKETSKKGVYSINVPKNEADHSEKLKSIMRQFDNKLRVKKSQEKARRWNQ